MCYEMSTDKNYKNTFEISTKNNIPLLTWQIVEYNKVYNNEVFFFIAQNRLKH